VIVHLQSLVAQGWLMWFHDQSVFTIEELLVSARNGFVYMQCLWLRMLNYTSRAHGYLVSNMKCQNFSVFDNHCV
jgi:hypothetical protein